MQPEEDWSKEISELKEYFRNAQMPDNIGLQPATTIKDVKKFIESHLRYVTANNGNKSYLPYLERLRRLKEITQ